MFHRIGFTHGDVRPFNFLRTTDGGFRIIDFSVSREHVCYDRNVDVVVRNRIVRQVSPDLFLSGTEC